MIAPTTMPAMEEPERDDFLEEGVEGEVEGLVADGAEGAAGAGGVEGDVAGVVVGVLAEGETPGATGESGAMACKTSRVDEDAWNSCLQDNSKEDLHQRLATAKARERKGGRMEKFRTESERVEPIGGGCRPPKA